MNIHLHRTTRAVAVLLAAATLAGCLGESSDLVQTDNRTNPSENPGNNEFVDTAGLQCALTDPNLLIGEGQDSPSISPASTPNRNVQPSTGLNSGACKNNTAFTMGTGIVDITGPPRDL